MRSRKRSIGGIASGVLARSAPGKHTLLRKALNGLNSPGCPFALALYRSEIVQLYHTIFELVTKHIRSHDGVLDSIRYSPQVPPKEAGGNPPGIDFPVCCIKWLPA